jgi:hypothetical protein
MEADWAVEIGPDLPSIDVPWEGFVDLRQNAAAQSAVQSIDEAAAYPALREVLSRLNSNASRVFTTKCDLWTLTRPEIDPDEFGARTADALHGFASYIDLLRRDTEAFRSFEFHEHWVRNLAFHLRTVDISNCRVDLVIRPASIDLCSGCGITLYAAGCGANTAAARASWETVLCAAVAATMNQDFFPSRKGE